MDITVEIGSHFLQKSISEASTVPSIPIPRTLNLWSQSWFYPTKKHRDPGGCLIWNDVFWYCNVRDGTIIPCLKTSGWRCNFTILKNDGVRQWEGWHPIYEMENKKWHLKKTKPLKPPYSTKTVYAPVSNAARENSGTKRRYSWDNFI